MLIVITGVPGTGKSEVSGILAKKMDAEILDLKRIAAEDNLITGYDFKRNSLIINEKKISKSVERRIKRGKRYIIDSLMGHYIKPSMVKLCVVLRTMPKILEKRLGKRRYNVRKIAENAAAERLDTVLIEALQNGFKNKLHEVDTSKRSARSVANEIVEIINNKKKKSYGKVNWNV